MDVIELLPRLYFLRFPVGHAYLWRDQDGLTLIDSNSPGSGSLIAEAIQGLGHDLGDLRRVTLTHCHIDHAGAAAEIAAWGHAAAKLKAAADRAAPPT